MKYFFKMYINTFLKLLLKSVKYQQINYFINVTYNCFLIAITNIVNCVSFEYKFFKIKID